MSEDLIYDSLIIVVLATALAMLIANILYISAAFRYRFEEGMAVLLLAASGYILFMLAKIQVLPLSDIVLSLFSNGVPPRYLNAASAIPAGVIGWLVGKFYAHHAKRGTYRSFRWSILLISVVHGILLDFVLLLTNSRESPPKNVLVSSGTFVVGIALAWAANVFGEEKGNVVDGVTLDQRTPTKVPEPNVSNPKDEGTSTSKYPF